MKQSGHILTRLFPLHLPFTAPFSYMIWSSACKVAAKWEFFRKLSLIGKNAGSRQACLFFISSASMRNWLRGAKAPWWNVREMIPGVLRLTGKRSPRWRATLGLVRPSARAGRKVAPEDAGDSLARRDVHLVEGKLNAPAGMNLVGTKLKERHDRLEPESVLNIRVRVIRNHFLAAGFVAFSRAGSRFAGGVIGLVRIRCTERVRIHARLASR